MNSNEKSILQVHLTDELILPYIVEDYLLSEHLGAQENEDEIHNVRYNTSIALKNSLVNIKLSRLQTTDSPFNSN